MQSGLVDEVIAVDKRASGGPGRALARLRAETWDLILCPHESPRTALWMARLRARQAKVGFRQWWNGFAFSNRVVKPRDFPDALRQLSLLAPVDGRLAELFGDEELQLLRSPDVRGGLVDFTRQPIPEWASMRLREPRPEGKRIFLAPGSVWETKKWTSAGYQNLARLLLQRGFSVELVGAKAERELCESIAAKVPGVVNHAGRTSLAGLVDLLATGRALVCNDSGAMHAAAIVGLPTVAVFGPTTLALGFRPWNDRAVVVQKDLRCRPCGKHGGRRCPLGTHECMEGISALEVMRGLDLLFRKDAELGFS
ncbi:MAG: glycosyltransferase family 9 protein [Calothrix sp. SM1_5_4]|nr:glycosyltransferase family 9 protein [Calothrix sp. SM1_5_4]